jgi:predicted nucleotidyltransferase
MNQANAWRLALAQKIGAVYAENPKVSVIVLAGSTARNMADRYSDIEIDLFWAEPPTDQDRKSAIERLGAKILIYWPFEDDEWGEAYAVGKLKVDLSSFLVETMDRYLTEVIDQADTTVDKQLLIAAVQHGVLLADTGGEQLRTWQAKAAAYSAALAEAMVKTYLQPDSRWYAREALAERDDALYLYSLFCQTEQKILGALLGLNRIYLPHPSFKWLDALVAGMELAPPNLSARLKQAFRNEPQAGVRELEQIVEETFALVEKHMPHLDLTKAKTEFRKRGPVLDSAPEGFYARPM